jgi:AcrR family transcriptional regulator
VVVDRRAAIADAAIVLIARDGVRALTHRALDRELDLPAGSSSYYLRTRRDLLTALVQRLADRTVADLVEPAERLRAPAAEAPSPESAARAMAGLLVHSMQTRADDHRARFALAAELIGDGELHPLITSESPIRRRLLAGAERTLAAIGVPDPAQRAPALVALADGILHDRLLGSRVGLPETPDERLADVTRTICDYLTGAVSPLRPAQ